MVSMQDVNYTWSVTLLIDLPCAESMYFIKAPKSPAPRRPSKNTFKLRLLKKSALKAAIFHLLAAME
jgi:hypothetical protein